MVSAPSVRLPLESESFETARGICRVLGRAGFEAWIVGGSVRDLVMGVSPHDWDIATSATPDKVISLFPRTIAVGVQFGVVIVRMHGLDFEVATFRADTGYSDGRRPDSVRFTDLREDVLRRDFTLNGLALDPETGAVVDLVGGIQDIADRLIRAIGDPEMRFQEDRLRPLRAIRFAAVTGFMIEPLTFEAIRRNAPFITQVSVERIAAEYSKMLTARDPSTGYRLAAASGLLAATIPELDPGDPTTPLVLDRLKGSAGDLMWAAMLHRVGPAGAADTLRRLKMPGRDCTAVSSIIQTALDLRTIRIDDVAAHKRILRRQSTPDALRLLRAWLEASGSTRTPAETADELLARYDTAALNPPALINGNDVLAAGIPNGPGIAAILKQVEDAQLRGSIGTREEALEMLARARGN
ncbi:MAG TPA: CCA tRNA nucleotidyltransferase [Myxococcota bacterium]|nr:CCA tRNA nucleotidyltransferase [Myxococcota bacterium]HPB49904.1 CCA tRNA nucleotidyltransferase [Myxococcota bacterium]HQP94957.1 CCA tRNA nucleotidyltransferase [Myxococcota bacterium]